MTNIIVTTKDELEGIIESSVRRAFSTHVPQENSNQDDFLTISQAAEYLNLAKQTLYGFTSTNQIPFIKKGKKLHFRKADLQAWVLEGKQKTIVEIQKELEGRK
jgi:excisionase family DNA binding protein